MPVSKDDELRHKLAAIEHERWSDWQKYMHGFLKVNDRGEYVLPADKVSHWDRQIMTPYEELSEAEKASDMEQVDRYWPLIQKFKEANSLCGCPMCEYHVTAAELQSQLKENKEE